MVTQFWTYDWHKYFAPPKLKIDLSNNPFTKDDIFEVTVNFPPIGTNIVIIIQYCEHHSMYYIFQSTNNTPWDCYFTVINRNNVWILRIGRKEQTTAQQVLEAISSKQLTGKLNRINAITARREKNLVRTNIQENRSILNQIRHIYTIGNKLISITTKPPTPDHIGNVIKTPLRYDWYDLIF